MERTREKKRGICVFVCVCVCVCVRVCVYRDECVAVCDGSCSVSVCVQIRAVQKPNAHD